MDCCLLRHFGLIDEQDWNSISDGVNPTAAGALKRTLIGRQFQRFAAVGDGTDKDVQELFEHRDYVNSSDYNLSVYQLAPNDGSYHLSFWRKDHQVSVASGGNASFFF